MSKCKVIKLTGLDLLHRANSFTTGKNSRMSLATAYRHGHSPIRTQLFWIELTDIPLYVASQLVRSHVGVQFFQRSKRTDRGGEDFPKECADLFFRLEDLIICSRWGMDEDDAGKYADKLSEIQKRIAELPNRFDRYAPTDLAFIINAEALMNMAHKRLCTKASAETRAVMSLIRSEIAKDDVDPDLAMHLVPQCVYRGGICPEPRSCGKNITSGDLIDKLYK